MVLRVGPGPECSCVPSHHTADSGIKTNGDAAGACCRLPGGPGAGVGPDAALVSQAGVPVAGVSLVTTPDLLRRGLRHTAVLTRLFVEWRHLHMRTT